MSYVLHNLTIFVNVVMEAGGNGPNSPDSTLVVTPFLNCYKNFIFDSNLSTLHQAW